MQQKWDKIIDFKKTEKNYSYLKSLATFYNKFGKFEIHFPLSHDSTKILFESNSHIIINIKINNKNYKFLFDTGSSDFLISKKIASDLNNDFISNTTNVLNDKDINKINVNYGLLSEIKIGDIIINNFPVYITNKMPKDFDGIIGWNLLKYFKIKINLKDNELIFYKNHLINNNKPNLFGNYLPLISLYLNTENSSNKLNLLFDSGSDNTSLSNDSNLNLLSSGIFLGIKKSFTSKSIYSYKKIKHGYLSFENSSESIEFQYLPLNFGKMKSQNVVVNGNLGLNIFKNKIIEIDLSANYFNVYD
jgi:predicted aspartyl protease